MYMHPDPKLLKFYSKLYKPATPHRLIVQAQIMREAKAAKREFLQRQGDLFTLSPRGKNPTPDGNR